MEKNKILIVDDEPVIIDLLARALNQQGYLVYSAKNGVEAFEMAKNELPQLIVLDMNMPIMNGEQAMALFKSHKEVSKIPVIIYSAYVEDPEKMKAMGALYAVNKSLGYKGLAECVSRFFSKNTTED